MMAMIATGKTEMTTSARSIRIGGEEGGAPGEAGRHLHAPEGDGQQADLAPVCPHMRTHGADQGVEHGPNRAEQPVSWIERKVGRGREPGVRRMGFVCPVVEVWVMPENVGIAVPFRSKSGTFRALRVKVRINE